MRRTRALLAIVCCLAAPLIASCTPEDGSPPADTTTTTLDPGPRCRVDLRIYKTAVQAYRAEHGAYPPDVAAINTSGYLDEPFDETRFSYQLVDGRGIVVGIGECAGV